MAGFRATQGGVSARFARPEAAIIRDLVSQVVELVGEPMPPGGAGAELARDPGADELAAFVGMADPEDPEAGEPDDPVLARLLPDAYRGDPEAAREFRRFTESGLRSAKVAAARALLATLPPEGGKVKLSAEEAESWLRSLNDVRLALGVRLGVTDESGELHGDIREEDPRFAYIQVYQWLAYLQESLVAALS